MRTRAMRAICVIGSVLVALLVLGAQGAAARTYPVPWTFSGGNQSSDPNSPPPGANDWSCRRSREHPRPVILVHGLGANRTVNWQTISPLLANHGYCVFAITYGTRSDEKLPGYQPGGLKRMQYSALQLRHFVNRVRSATGADQVDIVGHSEGSLMPNWYVKFLGGARYVENYVGMTPLWDGTNLAGIATINQIAAALGLTRPGHDFIADYCASCPQFLNGSAFLRKMNEGGAAVPGVNYTMIMTRNDELVNPYTSGYLAGTNVTNHVLQDQCALDQSEHLSVAADPTAAWDILNALDPAHPQPVPCTVVLPFIGAPFFTGG